MIRLEFDESAALLNEEVHVRLRVAETDLLWDRVAADSPPSPGLPLLVDRLATGGLLVLRHVRRTGESSLTLDESGDELLLRQVAGWLSIHSTQHRFEQIPKRTVQVDYGRFLRAWEAFAARVRTVVVERDPARAAWPDWRYLTEDDPRRMRWTQSPPILLEEHADCFDQIDAVDT